MLSAAHFPAVPVPSHHSSSPYLCTESPNSATPMGGTSTLPTKHLQIISPDDPGDGYDTAHAEGSFPGGTLPVRKEYRLPDEKFPWHMGTVTRHIHRPALISSPYGSVAHWSYPLPALHGLICVLFSDSCIASR